MNSELQRLREEAEKKIPWKKWGPYLAERQWGTVREDYSDSGDAWAYFTHDQARSRAYRWGEDGIAGISDDRQLLCFALAFWNGADPIIKERLFGLTNSEGNHGEDVKEYYYYLDSTPTHSAMTYLYKYPQRAYPYDELVAVNGARSRFHLEYELMDTGVFDDDRYFDIFVEYAKETPEDILIVVRVENRGPDEAALTLLPTLWFRNTWSWHGAGADQRPDIARNAAGGSSLTARHPGLGIRYLHCQGDPQFLFTENETNTARLFGTPNVTPYVKDGINEYIVNGAAGAVNPAGTGTRAAACYRLTVPARGSVEIRLRLTDRDAAAYAGGPFGAAFEKTRDERRADADVFYDDVSPDGLPADAARVMRQALAGMLWGKQYYHYDLDLWLDEHGANPTLGGKNRTVRNQQWVHMYNDDIISMPDKWEYPWYAAWDLAFHNIALVTVDPDFAKKQLDLMLRGFYLHPNGQIPAYEWNFSDVNPPVHAWATYFVYTIDRQLQGKPDVNFLKHAFQKLLINFTWWVNRKDNGGNNVFEGGFLGLDNIGVFDRSSPLPTGGYIEQADGTAWMALFSLNMLEIALELTRHDPAYEDFAIKFFEHFLWIASAMDRIGDQADELWDEEDGFFYDVLRVPDGNAFRLKVRSIVGLLPLCAVTVIYPDHLQNMPAFMESQRRLLRYHPELVANIALPDKPGVGDRRILSVLNEKKLRRVLGALLDPQEFLSDYGIRSLSKKHLEHPFTLKAAGHDFTVKYLPAESDNGMFGGNSNWRGPIWFPVNMLIVRALLQYYSYYGNDFQVECPTGSGVMMNLFEVSREISNRLTAIFLRDDSGHRPVFGGAEKFQDDPHWRDNVLFYEYFHGDNGAGLGASHQTGWTGAIARLIQLFGFIDGEKLLDDEARFTAAYREE